MPSALLVLDIGGTRMRLGHLVDGAPAAALEEVSSDALRRPDPLAVLTTLVRDYAERRGLALGGVVLGVPFSPDPTLETALSSPNLPNLEGVPLRSGLSERLRVPVRLERDINLLLLGEWWAGAARGFGSILGMFVGTGVGGCFLQHGRPFRGATGSAIELGHIPIRAEGRRCVCGNSDCLEAYASGHTLREIAARGGLAIGEVFRRGPEMPALRPDLDDFVRDLAYALATAVNLFHPQLALVGGGIPSMPGFPRERLRRIFYDHLRRPAPADTVELRWAELGSRAALYGALALGTERDLS